VGYLSPRELYEDPEGRAKAPEMGVCFHRGSALRNMDGRSFPGVFKRKEKFFI
jgi:hypothetical protein